MYVTNPQSKTPIFQINQHIGFDRDILDDDGVIVQQGDGQGIDGIVFANEVLEYNDADLTELLFYVNSQGGDVQRSLDMFNAISMSKQRTHSIITGFAFSCAGWIPLAADKVDMVIETGRWMCHMPYNPENPEEQSKFMDEVVDIISKTIASKSGRNGKPKKTQEEIKKLMREKTYWDADRMWNEGLIDNKVNASGKIIRFEKDPITLNSEEIKFYYKENQLALNRLIIESEEKETKLKSQEKIKIMFPKAVNRFNAISKEKTGISFNLTEDSSEEVIIDAISRLENRLRSNNDEMMDMENSSKAKDKIILDNKEAMDSAKKMADDKAKEASDAMCQYNTMKDAYDKMALDNKLMKDEKEAAENKLKEDDLKMRTERATLFVTSLEKDGKIKASNDMPIEDIKKYLINKATENFQDVVAQYSSVEGKNKFSAIKPKIASVKNEDGVELNIIEKLKADNILKIKKSQFRTIENTKVSLYPELA